VACNPDEGSLFIVLTPYLKQREVFRCPNDKGKISEHCHLHTNGTLLPTCWDTRGFSYEMNVGNPIGLPLHATKQKIAGVLINKDEGWVPDNSKFILFSEPPASLQVCHMFPPLFEPRWYQWHRNRGITDFLDPRLAPHAFYSPVLFVDGHARWLNFTKALCADPYFPFEETLDWAWYKPRAAN
jgi:prepilin-type processing-associated H-X9-DG protein